EQISSAAPRDAFICTFHFYHETENRELIYYKNKYIENIKKYNEYLLEFHIILKHSKLAVLIVNLPPNDENQV
ncbi:26329_t:CDS:1, partial [Dentiscutata erythropus]